MSRRSALWITGVLALALFAVLAALDAQLWDEGGPGIVGFELAGSEERSREILVEWGDEGRDAARLSLWLDYLYLTAYGAFAALAAAAVRRGSERRGQERFARFGRIAVPLAIAAAGFDALENVALLLALGEHGGEAAPLLGTVFAVAKFLCIDVVALYVLVGLVRAGLARRRRTTWAALGALGGLVLLFLALNAWIVERHTHDAKADGGRILELAGGDIHVREDGDPVDPPLVLIHGFTASSHWWDTVAPALAREHRVIRIDLLGHGGSEAPRGDYSMENQADLVAEAMDDLGVRSAPVVGHSMGGAVATALVERHRDRVERLMTIGTAPDTGRDVTLTDVIVFAPVAGPAVRTLVPRDLGRGQLEDAFIPEVDVPEQLVDDTLERTTYYSMRESGRKSTDYREDEPLHERLTGTGVPVTAVFGRRDPLIDHPLEAAEHFRSVPGARVIVLDDVGHTPQIESPAEAERLILEFAR